MCLSTFLLSFSILNEPYIAPLFPSPVGKPPVLFPNTQESIMSFLLILSLDYADKPLKQKRMMSLPFTPLMGSSPALLSIPTGDSYIKSSPPCTNRSHQETRPGKAL